MKRLTTSAVLAGVFLLFTAGATLAGHAVMGGGNRLHWGDNEPNFPRGYMYWHDKTGAAWPVYASAVEWDKETRLDAVYVSGANSCTSFRCVPVTETDFNNTGCAAPWGYANWTYNSSGHFTSAQMQVDRQCDSRTAADRRELVCHEMGHTIGLDERSSTADTCMRTGNMIGKQYPDPHDFEVLHYSYGHDV